MLNRLEMMRIFCAAAEANSFKEAAERLGVSPQAVTRAIKELEDAVGEPLFYRNTRQIRITEFGAQLANRAREAVGSIDKLFTRTGKQADHEIAGVVRITAPTIIGRKYLLPILNSIMADYPHITLDLRLSNKHADVVEQQIDIGIRIGFLRDNNFIARPAAKIAFYVACTPELIQRYGIPQQLQDLIELPAIGLIDQSSGRSWPWYFANGVQINPRNVVFITDDAETELDQVLNGVGFAQIADCFADPYIQSGKLVRVLEQYTAPPWQLYIYRPQKGPVSNRVRIVYDRIYDALANPLTFQTS